MGYKIAAGSAGAYVWRRSRSIPDGLRLRTLTPRDRLPPAAAVPPEAVPELADHIDAMLDVMRGGGYSAISGPLVGLHARVIAIDLSTSGRSQIVLINPVLERVSGERQRDREGCLGLPGVTASVERPGWVVARGWSRNGQPVTLHAGGILGRVLQHQMDHLSGLTLLDRLGPRERARVESRMRSKSDLPPGPP